MKYKNYTKVIDRICILDKNLTIKYHHIYKTYIISK